MEQEDMIIFTRPTAMFICGFGHFINTRKGLRQVRKQLNILLLMKSTAYTLPFFLHLKDRNSQFLFGAERESTHRYVRHSGSVAHMLNLWVLGVYRYWWLPPTLFTCQGEEEECDESPIRGNCLIEEFA